MPKKILIMGLPGAGKTTLAARLAPRLGAVLFNADDIRANVNRDLGFSLEDRLEQARRMGHLCDLVTKSGSDAIADFVCPTKDARDAFGADDAYIVWLDRIEQGRFEDTNRIFEKPERVDMHVTAEGAPEMWAERIVRDLRPVFDPKKPTALFVGRYQPFHDGHRALIEQGIERVGQVCIAIRDTSGTDNANPLGFHDVRQRIERALMAHEGRFIIVPLPNITHILYGQDVGYTVEQIGLPEELELLSATSIRLASGI